MRVIKPTGWASSSSICDHLFFAVALALMPGAVFAASGPMSGETLKKKLDIPTASYQLIGTSKDCQDQGLTFEFATVGDNVTAHLGERFIFPNINQNEFTEKLDAEKGETCTVKTVNVLEVRKLHQTVTQLCTDQRHSFEVRQSLIYSGSRLTYRYDNREISTGKSTQFECSYERARESSR